MPLTISCPTCAAVVTCDREEIGSEKYCPSCGRLILIPNEADDLGIAAGEDESASTLPEPDKPVAREEITGLSTTASKHLQQPDRNQPRVFSSDGFKHEDYVVRSIACLCGNTFPLYARDIGSIVYCPQCQGEVSVDDQLEKRRQTEVISTPREPTVSSRAPRRWSSAGVTLLVVMGFATVWVARQIPQSPPPPASKEFRPLQRSPKYLEDTREFNPDEITEQTISDLASEENAIDALLRAAAWKLGLNKFQVPDSDPRFAQLERLSHTILAQREAEILKQIESLLTAADADHALKLAQGWYPLFTGFLDLEQNHPVVSSLAHTTSELAVKADPITLEEINSLLQQHDHAEALMIAEILQETLLDRQTPAHDPRVRRLEEIIELLRKKLLPPPLASEALLAQFRELVQRLAEAVNREEMSQAKELSAEAEKILQSHPDELGPYARRFLELKQQLLDLQLRVEGLSQIRALIDQAEQAIANERVGEALEAKARAKFLCRRTPIAPSDAEELMARMRTLSPRLLLARGRRAAQDAVRGDEEGDIASRNEQVREAYRFLSELPKSQIESLLEMIERWQEEAFAAPTTTHVKYSQLGTELKLRQMYETALEYFDQDNKDRLIEACSRKATVVGGSSLQQDELRKKLQKLLFDVLEREVTLVISQPRDPANSSMVGPAQVRRWLDSTADSWSSTAEWKALNAAYERRSTEAAQRLLDRANEAAQRDELEIAAEIAKQAQEFRVPDVSDRAQKLRMHCQDELRIRRDKTAEVELWNKLQASLKSGSDLEIWQEAVKFLQRYPSGAHAEQVREIKAEITDRLSSQVTKQLASIRESLLQKKWADAHRRMALLKDVPIPADAQVEFDQLTEEVGELTDRAARQFSNISLRLRHMGGEVAILEARDILAEVLALDPNHAEARDLWSKSQERGAVAAEKLLKGVAIYHDRTNKHRIDKLNRIVRLDPYGPHGKKARELLDEVN